MTTGGLNRLDMLDRPGRGAVGKILSAADQANREHQAVTEIRELLNGLDKKQPLIPARRIRQIMKRHGVE
jgi:chorismate-pyruvate lyase